MLGIHGPVEGSLEAPLTALAELRQRGLIRHIGLSSVTAQQVEDGRRICDIACVQNHYNLAYRSDDALIKQLASDGIAYAPFFSAGRLHALAVEFVVGRGCRPPRNAYAGGAGLAIAALSKCCAYSGHLIGRALATEPGSFKSAVANRGHRQVGHCGGNRCCSLSEGSACLPVAARLPGGSEPAVRRCQELAGCVSPAPLLEADLGGSWS